jgi:hypothetical protein
MLMVCLDNWMMLMIMRLGEWVWAPAKVVACLSGKTKLVSSSSGGGSLRIEGWRPV